MDTTAQPMATTAAPERRRPGRRTLSTPLMPLLQAGVAAESGWPTLAAMWIGPQRGCVVAAMWSEAG